MPERTVITRETHISEQQAVVWGYAINKINLAKLCRGAFDIDVIFEDMPLLASDGRVFIVRIKPHDILLTSAGCSFALRFIADGHGCRVLIAASYDMSAKVMPTQSQIEALLRALKSQIEPHSGPRIYSEIAVAGQEQRQETNGSDVSSGWVEFKYYDSTQADSEYKIPARHEMTAKAKKKRWPAVVVVTAVVIVAALTASYFLIPQLSGLFETPPPSDDSYSAKVTCKSAMSVNLGDAKDSVERLFGTGGAESDTMTVYRGGRVEDGEKPTIQVAVEYIDSKVSKITYLDLELSTKINAEYKTKFKPKPDMTIEDVASGVDAQPSMIRKYQGESGEIVEVHFGFCDPFANFDPAWRGEMAIILDKEGTAASKHFWGGYDGSDPLMIGELDGHRVSNQYDSYTDFLNDKYQYDRALNMLNRYSKKDVVAAFGPIEPYHGIDDAEFYINDSEEVLPGGDMPIYRMTFGFDDKGQFLVSSFSNTRLFDKEGMLEGIKYAGITRGMAYNEIRYIMGILPTAIFVDINYYTLCYGRRLDSNIFESQFEYIVKIDIENNCVQSFWDNTEKS